MVLQQNHCDRDIYTNDTKLTWGECNQRRTRPNCLILSLQHDAIMSKESPKGCEFRHDSKTATNVGVYYLFNFKTLKIQNYCTYDTNYFR